MATVTSRGRSTLVAAMAAVLLTGAADRSAAAGWERAHVVAKRSTDYPFVATQLSLLEGGRGLVTWVDDPRADRDGWRLWAAARGAHGRVQAPRRVPVGGRVLSYSAIAAGRRVLIAAVRAPTSTERYALSVTGWKPGVGFTRPAELDPAIDDHSLGVAANADGDVALIWSSLVSGQPVPVVAASWGGGAFRRLSLPAGWSEESGSRGADVAVGPRGEIFVARSESGRELEAATWTRTGQIGSVQTVRVAPPRPEGERFLGISGVEAEWPGDERRYLAWKLLERTCGWNWCGDLEFAAAQPGQEFAAHAYAADVSGVEPFRLLEHARGGALLVWGNTIEGSGADALRISAAGGPLGTASLPDLNSEAIAVTSRGATYALHSTCRSVECEGAALRAMYPLRGGAHRRVTTLARADGIHGETLVRNRRGDLAAIWVEADWPDWQEPATVLKLAVRPRRR